ncbi:hypothetical protein EYR41_007351 [Orbilia oligospora]|uniref:Uncharacterized protein n=3 Tax=Orbilia oligospora TaxID=2813651 RepID=A0A8H2E0N3_ORBOL|nr:hypothetical protein EYR41_007351 [Orbilia oligospora]
MAKRKRAGKKSASQNHNHNHHKSAHHRAAAQSTSAEQEHQLDYEDTVTNQNDENRDDEAEGAEPTAEDEDYVWGAKPLKSSKAGFFGSGPKGYIDPSTNQRGAFPELQGIDDDADLSGPAFDGLSYLRMVRHEARGVPNLLTASQMTGIAPSVKVSNIVIAAPLPAPTSRPMVPQDVDNLLYDDDNVVEYNKTHQPPTEPIDATSYDEVTKPENNTELAGKEPGSLSYDDENEDGGDDDEWGEEWDEEDPYGDLSDSDSSAYYVDGAYIARPVPMLARVTTASALPPRTVSDDWHASLITNFHTTREAILTTPFEDPEIPFPVIPTQWKDFMVANQPSLPVLQTISSENAIKALKHLRKYLGWRNVNEWQGKWIWALLARANDVGILMNEEVSVLRELGKKAVFNLEKASDARIKIVEEGGEDWWNEELQRGVMEYMGGGGQDPAACGGEGVKTDEQVGFPVEFKIEDLDFGAEDQDVETGEAGSGGEDESVKEERPTKKMALFKPRAVQIPKPSSGSTLSVPSISVIPATPGTGDVENPMEDPLSVNQLLPDAVDTPDDDLASAQLQMEMELAPVSNDAGDVVESKDSVEDGELDAGAVDKAQRMPDVKTVFALDMIVSIVGEVFGQRDLLLERR